MDTCSTLDGSRPISTCERHSDTCQRDHSCSTLDGSRPISTSGTPFRTIYVPNLQYPRRVTPYLNYKSFYYDCRSIRLAVPSTGHALSQRPRAWASWAFNESCSTLDGSRPISTLPAGGGSIEFSELAVPSTGHALSQRQDCLVDRQRDQDLAVPSTGHALSQPPPGSAVCC